MTILQVYQNYKIMLSLQTHQLRVAAVAGFISKNFSEKINREDVVQACLLHDMGNIIKFDLAVFPQYLEPEGLNYWQSVQNDFVSKYGSNEHQASLEIAKELGVSNRVLQIIDSISFENNAKSFQEKDFEKLICEYADNRVTPHGVVGLEERLSDLQERYAHRYPSQEDALKRQKYFQTAREIEKYLFDFVRIEPGEINDKQINSDFEKLGEYKFSL